jgi:hypothetical protein
MSASVSGARKGDEAMTSPAILRPYHPAEVIGTSEAAERAAVSERCMRNWCMEHHVGRKVSGHYGVSQVALAMKLDGNDAALETYLAGERATPIVAAYYKRLGIELPST